MLAVLLVTVSIAGLVLIALGLPGLWVIVAAVVIGGTVTGFHTIGAGTIAIVIALALLGELFELWFGYGLARRYGGSKRAGWGALLGRVAATAAKMTLGIVIAVVAVFAALRR